MAETTFSFREPSRPECLLKKLFGVLAGLGFDTAVTSLSVLLSMRIR